MMIGLASRIAQRALPLAVGVAISLIACRDHRIIQPTLALPNPGTPVPGFSFATRDSGRLRSSDLTGRPTVLFLWSTHCPTSRRALAAYREIQRVYSLRGARVVMLSDDESSAELALLPKVLVDSSIVGELALARGRLGSVFDRSGSAPERDTARVQFVLPAYLVIDRDGKVAGRSWGPDAQHVRMILDSLLASRQPNGDSWAPVPRLPAARQ